MNDHLAVPTTAPHQSHEISPSAGAVRYTDQDNNEREREDHRHDEENVREAITASQRTVQGLEESVLHLKEGLHGLRDLLKEYQRTRNHWERQAQLRQRADENWIPNISQDIDASQAVTDRILDKLPPLEDRLNAQLERYQRGKQQAAHIQTQLEWYAASWTNKLRKILFGEVKEKRVKLLRIAAPFLLGAVVLLIVGLVGRISLVWTLFYYRNLRRSLKS